MITKNKNSILKYGAWLQFDFSFYLQGYSEIYLLPILERVLTKLVGFEIKSGLC